MQLHERIKFQRKLKDESQVQMAISLGIARQTYLDIESGKTEPKVSMVVNIAELLECDLVWLITGEHQFSENKLDKVKMGLEQLTKSIGEL